MKDKVIPLGFHCCSSNAPRVQHLCFLIDVLLQGLGIKESTKKKNRLLGSRLRDFFSCNQLQTKHAACCHFHVLVLLWFVLVLVVMTFAVVTSSHRLASSQLQKRAGSCSCFSKLRNWATSKHAMQKTNENETKLHFVREFLYPT